MVKVVIADDHAVVREGLKAVLSRAPELVVVAEAADGHEALRAVAATSPHVLLLDLTMPRANGLHLIARLRKEAPATRVLILSMHAAPEFVRPALHAGAMGYLVKGAGIEDLVEAIFTVARGEQFFDAAAEAVLAHESMEQAREVDPLRQLTLREREVLQLVAEGATNREMAARLGISPKTVDTHRTSLMRKLDLHSAQALTRLAMRRGLVSPE